MGVTLVAIDDDDRAALRALADGSTAPGADYLAERARAIISRPGIPVETAGGLMAALSQSWRVAQAFERVQAWAAEQGGMVLLQHTGAAVQPWEVVLTSGAGEIVSEARGEDPATALLTAASGLDGRVRELPAAPRATCGGAFLSDGMGGCVGFLSPGAPQGGVKFSLQVELVAPLTGQQVYRDGAEPQDGWSFYSDTGRRGRVLMLWKGEHPVATEVINKRTPG